MILEENWISKKKQKNIRNEKIMKRFRMHFAIFIRQRDEKIQTNLRSRQHQEKYLEENAEYRKLEKFSRSEKNQFTRKKYRIP